MNQCWPDSLTDICGTRGRWMNFLVFIWLKQNIYDIKPRCSVFDLHIGDVFLKKKSDFCSVFRKHRIFVGLWQKKNGCNFLVQDNNQQFFCHHHINYIWGRIYTYRHTYDESNWNGNHKLSVRTLSNYQKVLHIRNQIISAYIGNCCFTTLYIKPQIKPTTLVLISQIGRFFTMVPLTTSLYITVQQH